MSRDVVPTDKLFKAMLFVKDASSFFPEFPLYMLWKPAATFWIQLFSEPTQDVSCLLLLLLFAPFCIIVVLLLSFCVVVVVVVAEVVICPSPAVFSTCPTSVSFTTSFCPSVVFSSSLFTYSFVLPIIFFRLILSFHLLF